MFCKKCRSCGLCEGDSSSVENPEGFILSSSSLYLNENPSLPSSALGLAFDIGTTSIACAAYSLKNGKFLFSFGELNSQVKYAGDVVSRISFSLKNDGLLKLQKSITEQIALMIKRALLMAQGFFKNSAGHLFLDSIVIAGNTVMESIFAGISLDSLSVYPFSISERFGKFYKASSFIPSLSDSVKLFIMPVISAFVGGDTVSALLSISENDDESKNKKDFLLVDMGTNCEIVVFCDNQYICTSAAAGPAFEGYGMEKGCLASQGAVSCVEFNFDGTLKSLSVLGKTKPSGICGSGYFSALSSALEKKLISLEGEILLKGGKLFLDKDIFISQSDVRNFQLAKSAVRTGIEILLSELKVGEDIFCNLELYLCGGFSSSVKKEDALRLGMIPPFLQKKNNSASNASLDGAARLLCKNELMKKSLEIAQNARTVNLAEHNSFQTLFLKNLNF